MAALPIYENKEEISNTYLPLHAAMLNLASSYSDEELELITTFLGKASTVLEQQIHHLNASARSSNLVESLVNDKKDDKLQSHLTSRYRLLSCLFLTLST